ncbi:hypothetical protein GYMLUDRAFT_264732 [Collybiopsis luxurians FD-317 M1]|uniref:Nephrocystin 3-like N-terminal domain-containing protein n=1 Tax=Collybiopsis luxurians FD-317 M1 TaxID=944289 RepID=A0A0D0BWV2_9AGAR|nr:hypothetical protein GYMLUDRAFT_264732 [Collybiopsis luxurians FD-317 M1]
MKRASSSIQSDFWFSYAGTTGLLQLFAYSSKSAQFNAEARMPPPLCHPGTREAVLRDLECWVHPHPGQVDPIPRRIHSDNSSIIGIRTIDGYHAEDDCTACWLYGPAGAGKSAIAQTLAETCARRGVLAASFFFWRTDPSRNNPQRLFTTIALQLAISIPELRPIIDAAVIDDPSILTSSIENQFEKLIAQPFRKIHEAHEEEVVNSSTEYGKRRSPSPRLSYAPKRSRINHNADIALSSDSTRAQILIIDGLDECSDPPNQQRILSILGNAMQNGLLPLRVLIASRPEPRIKEVFNGPSFIRICHRMCLDNTYQASCDIRVFLQDRFQDILQRHSCNMEHVPRPWPTHNQIESLVQHASGQFIYPTTILKFIDDDSAVPADRLNMVLNLAQPDKGSESPFVELDALYRQILSMQKNSTVIVQILGAIVAYRTADSPSRKGPELITLLSTQMNSKGALCAALSGLHSLFQGPTPVESNLEFCHVSFWDFLLDRRRSMEYFIDKAIGHDYLAQSFKYRLSIGILQDTGLTMAFTQTAVPNFYADLNRLIFIL